MTDNSRIGKIIEAVGEAEGLLNEFLTPDIQSLMTPEQLKELENVRKMVNIDMPNASKELEKINEKYNRNGTSNR